MNYLQGLGTDFWTYTDLTTGGSVIFPSPDIYTPDPTLYANGQFAYSDTAPPPDSTAANWVSTLPVIGNFLVQTGILHPPVPAGYRTPPPGGYKQPTSNFTTYMILGGLGIGALLLVKMLMKKD